LSTGLADHLIQVDNEIIFSKNDGACFCVNAVTKIWQKLGYNALLFNKLGDCYACGVGECGK
jgi:hypothetical protein